jgi:hypothetical protein
MTPTRIFFAVVLLLSQAAQADSVRRQGSTARYYDSHGSYTGQSRDQGNTTRYYGSTGRYEGQARQHGNTTRYYSRDGRYQGQAQGANPSRSFLESDQQ